MIRDASTILRCDDDGLCRVIWVVVPIIIRLFRVPKKGPYFGQPPRCISASVTKLLAPPPQGTKEESSRPDPELQAPAAAALP